MNGITLNKDKTLFPSQIEKKRKELDRFKLTISLILMNIVFYFLFFFVNNSPSNEIKNSYPSIDHKDHVKIKLNLNVLSYVKEDIPEYLVSIYNSSGKLIVDKAYLHLSEKNIEISSEHESETQVVEIPKNMLTHILKNKNSELYAVPYIKKTGIKKRNSKYEIIF